MTDGRDTGALCQSRWCHSPGNCFPDLYDFGALFGSYQKIGKGARHFTR